MVRFEDKQLVIEIRSDDPVETWIDLQTSLCDVIRNVRQETIADDTFFAAIDLLREMVPEWELARAMREKR